MYKKEISFLQKSSIASLFILCIFSLQKINAQVVYGETVQTLEYRLQQDSNLYWQLAERFANADTVLNENQLSLLYYGYALQPEYDLTKEDRILDAANSLGRRQRYDEAMNLLNNFLAKNPGCLPALLDQAYTAWLMDDSLGTVNGFKKYYLLLDVPINSGSGNSAEDAMVVSSERDIELILDKKGYYFKAKSLIIKNGQHFYLVTCETADETKAKKVFYFNVNLPFTRGRQRGLQKH